LEFVIFTQNSKVEPSTYRLTRKNRFSLLQEIEVNTMARVATLLPVERFEVPGAVIPEALTFHFENDHSEAAIIAACSNAEFLFVPANYPPITARIIENIPTVRMIQSHGTGFNRIDTAAAARLEIPVANVPGLNSGTVAEYVIGLIIALQRRIVVADREIKAGKYTAARRDLFKQGLNEITGSRLGIVGMGAIGRRVAKLAGILGASVMYHDLYRADAQLESELKIEYTTLEKLLSGSDIVTVHVPLTTGTAGLMGEKEIGAMPRGSILINACRGEVVDQMVLADALETGHLHGAAIDTVSPEPPPPEHPLLNLSPVARDRLILTPHIAGITDQAFGRLLNHALSNISRVVSGKPPENVVNGVLEARLRKNKEKH
jgi:phosphoglycerate dehydrogenase-like enzyme